MDTTPPKSHIKVDGYYQGLLYKYPRESGGGSSLIIANRNRAIRGRSLLQQLNAVRQQFQIDQNEDIPSGIVRDNVIYVEFTSSWGYELKFESLDKDSSRPSSF